MRVWFHEQARRIQVARSLCWRCGGKNRVENRSRGTRREAQKSRDRERAQQHHGNDDSAFQHHHNVEGLQSKANGKSDSNELKNFVANHSENATKNATKAPELTQYLQSARLVEIRTFNSGRGSTISRFERACADIY